MAWNKELVYIPELNPDTWLLKSVREDSACLRDYSVRPASLDRTHSAAELEKLLEAPNAFREKVPAMAYVPTEAYEFWKSQILLRNIESNLDEVGVRRRLQSMFHDECSESLDGENPIELRAIFERWIDRFGDAIDRESFNHWDDDPTVYFFDDNRGLAWQAKILEHCRRAGDIGYVDTGSVETEFFLAAMEYGFGISSTRNRFRRLVPDTLNPDGIAIRPNGHFTVIEVKREKDDASLITPMMQATCAALATFAKRENICEIASTTATLRPAFANVSIPERKRSLGVHVLTATNSDGTPRTPWTADVETKCKTVLNAFPQLRYIAYSFITPDQAKAMTAFNTDRLVIADSD